MTCEETDEGIVSDQSYEYEDVVVSTSTDNKMRTKVRQGDVDPDPELDPDLVGSETFCRIRAALTRNEFETKLL